MTDGISSGTVEVQCGDLSGPALDWAVAKVENVFVHIGDPELGDELRVFFVSGRGMPCVVRYSPSTDWRFGGPLIDKYRVSLIYAFEQYEALIGMTASEQHETPLVAACRAIVSEHLGEVVSVPAELA